MVQNKLVIGGFATLVMLLTIGAGLLSTSALNATTGTTLQTDAPEAPVEVSKIASEAFDAIVNEADASTDESHADVTIDTADAQAEVAEQLVIANAADAATDQHSATAASDETDAEAAAAEQAAISDANQADAATDQHTGTISEDIDTPDETLANVDDSSTDQSHANLSIDETDAEAAAAEQAAIADANQADATTDQHTGIISEDIDTPDETLANAADSATDQSHGGN